MNSLDLVNKLYKPYKITKKGKCTIIESTSGKYVIKEKENDLNKVYNYLKSRGFYSFPKLVDYSRSDINILEYINDFNYPDEQRAEDLIDLVIDLHTKTSFSKEVRPNEYKNIYENIENNLNYYKYYYDSLLKLCEEDIFPSPSHQMFLRNYSKLINEVNYCFDRLNEWYDLVKDESMKKVCQIHNNLKINHLIKDDDLFLISFDKSKIDSPVLDIYKFYKSESLNVDFTSLLSKYLNSGILNEHDKELLLLLICLPVDIKFEENEFSSCKGLTNAFDYVYKTEKLISSYNFKENK